MCIEAMDTSPKHENNDYLLKSMKPGSKLRWKLPRVFMEGEALKRCGATAARSIRKHLRRKHRRAKLAKLTKVLGAIGKVDKEESPAAAYQHYVPPGAMAPHNTTQYLMGNIYDDMRIDLETVPVSHVTPQYAALDTDYDNCLSFQQRDFDELFDQYLE